MSAAVPPPLPPRVPLPPPPVPTSGGTEPLAEGVDLVGLAEGPREECGVFGVYAPGEDVATLTYFGLYALQHRGQESAGIAVSDGVRTVVHKDMGLVNQVFKEHHLASLPGHVAIGHCRYSTAGASCWDNAQPIYRETNGGARIALGHNGNLVGTAALAERLGLPDATDSELMTALIASHDGMDVEAAILTSARELAGGFSVVVSDERRLYALRDPNGIRPLQIGRLPGGGWVIASETAALEIVGAVLVRDVEPGELVVIDEQGLRSRRFAEATPTFCLFEWVYLARPDHRQDGSSVLHARRRMGRRLAEEAPVEADVVIPVPEAGRDAAAGFAEAAGLPFADGLVKNRYVGRTFIQPTQSLRQLGIRLKLSPVREVVEGRRLVVVDDSIVRGNTSRQLVAMLRAAGAAEVHLRITSPPVAHPCYYGIDMASRAELIGADLDVEQVRAFVGADSLHYLSLDGLIGATPTPRGRSCTACFSGDYPIPVPAEDARLAQARLDVGAPGTAGHG
jgi:amidophosphoribosyltransferase